MFGDGGSQIVGGLIAGGAALVYAIYRLDVLRAVVQDFRKSNAPREPDLTSAVNRGRAIDMAAAELRISDEISRLTAPVSLELVKVLEGADNPATPDNYVVIVMKNEGGKCVGAQAESPSCSVHVDPSDLSPDCEVHLTLTDITTDPEIPVTITLTYTNAAGSTAKCAMLFDRVAGGMS